MNDDTPPSVSLPLAGWEDFFIVLGAIVLAALIAFIWIAFFRKKRTHLHRHHRHGKSPKKRRREHRQLNPTLAQTGGLPPIRQEEKGLPGHTPSPPQLP